MAHLKEIAPHLISAYPQSGLELDTVSKGFRLDLSKPLDAFLAMCLGIMYAFPILPRFADEAMKEILARDHAHRLFAPQTLASAYRGIQKLKYRERLKRISTLLPEQFAIISSTYRRVPSLVLLNMCKAASIVLERLDGDVSRLFRFVDYQPKQVISELRSWRIRLDIKAFWLCREMREQNVWVDPAGNAIDGSVCCVVDIQVTRALIHLKCYVPERDIFYHSELIWRAFGRYYDLPLLWLARNYCSIGECLACPLRHVVSCDSGQKQLSLYGDS